MHDPLIDGVDKQALNEGHGGQAESGKRNQRGDDRVVPLQKGQDQVARNAALSIMPSARPKEVNRVCCTANQTIGERRRLPGISRT